VSLSRTIADFEILRARAALAISAKSGSGSLTVSVFMRTSVIRFPQYGNTQPARYARYEQ
jgi:hypothetical protein